jgi:hypothetical protein
MRRKLFKARNRILDVKRIMEVQSGNFKEIIRKNLLIYPSSLVPNTAIEEKIVVNLFGHKLLEIHRYPRKLQPVIYGHRW